MLFFIQSEDDQALAGFTEFPTLGVDFEDLFDDVLGDHTAYGNQGSNRISR